MGQGARAAKLTACESAIYFCCDPYSNSLLPLRCFELNRCPGLYWAGPRICSDQFIDKVTRKRFRPVIETRNSINETPDEGKTRVNVCILYINMYFFVTPCKVTYNLILLILL